ncbi:hypothetical protein BCV70DRAFT_202869 [Testicularia cyperi]|uniref:Uncharacterized protein n=1 Tax=Testicularia cyperi TaxID=1882483 RepID=A0A317XGE7_9BASI|nr:hypothetical protein BCV70DRAFT_202869 [Testicularia cyperi]
MVTYHKQSQWTAREGRHNILAIWNGEYLGRLGYRLVLRGFVVPGRDWGAYDHPSFVTYDRVPNSFETLYQRRTPEVSEQPAQNPIAHE